MKKLFIVMGFFAAILLTSSCTADSPVETQNEKLTIPAKVSDPRTDISADEMDEPTPPKK